MRHLTNLGLALALLPGLAALSRPAAGDTFLRDDSTLTITRPLHVPGAVLPPGTYVVRLVSTDDSHHVVQITNVDGTKVLSTTIATPDDRLASRPKTEFVFEEADGQPVALRSWWAPDDRFGQDLVYSAEEEQQIRADAARIAEAHLKSPSETALARSGSESARDVVPAVRRTVAPAPKPAAAPAEKKPTTLPHTASDTPLLLFVGVVALGAAAALRQNARSAA